MANPPYKLQLTNGYVVDLTQIARLLKIVCTVMPQPGRIPQEFIASELGFSTQEDRRNRTKNLCGVAVAFGLIRPIVLTPTELGKLVYRYDSFLDDLGTLWLLHYLISSNERYVIWNRLVNHVIPENDRFWTSVARPYFDDLSQFYSERTMNEHPRNETAVVWNAYTEQAFRYLDYIKAEREQVYVRGDRTPVPPHVFFAAVLSYRNRFAPNVTTLEISQLINSVNSPGRVFGMSSWQVRDILEEVKNLGYIYIETRADLDQIRFRDNGTFLEVIRRYYEER
jgi:hypothetical protein